ncbi:dihydrolipoamide acetyltransferase family protein [Lysinibacillus sp. LZ02]|uniref:dihydrolipoamide acetyltransferase family protein n=1 Tax=Lysinibacillus sp. LZ02 TaxID=3420668 RepID=UPI003D35DE0F
MIQNITMPQLGESVTEGTIERWLVKVGDRVNKYDPLAEVLTDKVQAEIPSSFSGIIQELIAVEGETLPVGAVVCTVQIESSDELPSAPEIKKSNVSAAILNAGVHKPLSKKEDTSSKRELREPKAKARYSPAVLKLAAEYAVDLEKVEGTGFEGRITRKDVLAMINTGQQQSEPVPTPVVLEVQQEVQQNVPLRKEQTALQSGDIELPITSVRRAIANNMVRSKQEIPHAWMMIEVDVTELVAYRDAMKEEFKRQEGYNLTYFAFFIKAVAQALKEFPMINSTWAGDKIIQKKDIHMSIAVAADDQLFVPVIKHADEKSIKGIAREIHELSQLARTKNLRPEHVSDGTFTINNTGSFGSIQSAGIINYPQAAILQVESIVKKPVVIGGNMLAIRDIVNLCLSLDHRVLDGLICGNFLKRVKKILENTDKNKMSVY